MTAVASVLALSGDLSARGAVPGHGMHYASLAIGLAGLGALGLAHVRGRSEDERHERHDRPGSVDADARAIARRPADAERAWISLWQPRQLPLAERVVVPLAFVSSAAAAGGHVAMGPPHFRENLLFGAFFAATALLQLLWAGMLAVHRTRALLVLGALGNLAVLGLWALTRTVGLPFGLLPHPEAVGPWDLACGAWELAVVSGCVVLLRSRRTAGQVAPWRDWHRSARIFVAGSVLLLGALTFAGSAA